MQLRFYRLRQLASVSAREDKPARQGRYPFSAATLWRWVAAGKFPAPIKINGATAWPAEVIEAWEEAQQATKPAEGPRKAAEGPRKAAAASVAARRGRVAEVSE